MTQGDYIKEIARLALSNDNNRLIELLYDFVSYSQKNNRTKFAIQLQEIIKETGRTEEIGKLREINYRSDIDNGCEDVILQKVMSSYVLNDLICTDNVKSELRYFIREREALSSFTSIGIFPSNKLILHGPSGCGKTLAAYVLAGELHQPLFIINLGAIVSSRLGETSRNLTHIFKRASYEKAIIFLDEFDSIGKIRDYDQDHGEMKRVVNTILQLFDFLSKDSVVIAATNQIKMIDDALLRRFDISIKLDYPQTEQIERLISSTIRNRFEFNNTLIKNEVINLCHNISYYSIKKTLLTTIKRSLLDKGPNNKTIDSGLWKTLIESEINRNEL